MQLRLFDCSLMQVLIFDGAGAWQANEEEEMDNARDKVLSLSLNLSLALSRSLARSLAGSASLSFRRDGHPNPFDRERVFY